jgi:hypothetical protein
MRMPTKKLNPDPIDELLRMSSDGPGELSPGLFVSLAVPGVRHVRHRCLPRYDRNPEDYLATLFEAWLRDLAYHGKYQTPPGSAELAATGLLDRLSGGDTRREVSFGGDLIP